LLITLRETIEAVEISARQAKSIVGKLIHIKALLPAAKFNISHIMRLVASDPDIDLDNTFVKLEPSVKDSSGIGSCFSRLAQAGSLSQSNWSLCHGPSRYTQMLPAAR
jgi:hypothetical protein